MLKPFTQPTFATKRDGDPSRKAQGDTHFYSEALDVQLTTSAKEAFGDVWLRAIFPDVVVFDRYEDTGTGMMGTKTYQAPYAKMSGAYAFGPEAEVETAFVEKRVEQSELWKATKGAADGGMLAGPLFADKADDGTQHIAYSAVLVPGEPDSDGERLTAEKINEVAETWMSEYGNTDLMHSLNNVKTSVVKSWTLETPKTVTALDGEEMVLPIGTWMLGLKIRDESVWESILSGDDGSIKGLSIMGVPKATMADFTASGKSMNMENMIDVGLKRTLLADLGPDWVAPFVSFVDFPAVPKAKIFALKSAAKTKVKPGVVERFFGAFTGSTKTGRVFSAANEKKLRDAHATITELIAMLDEDNTDTKTKKARQGEEGEMTQEEINAAVAEALKGEAVAGAIGAAVKTAMEPVQAQVTGLAEQVAAFKPVAPANADPDANEVTIPDDIEAMDEPALKRALVEARANPATPAPKAPAASKSLPASKDKEDEKPADDGVYVGGDGVKRRRDGAGRAVVVA